MNLFQALINTVLPVFMLAGLGWVARVYLKAEVRDPSRLTIYIMTPGLIMNSILTSKLQAGEINKILGYELLLTFLMIGLTFLIVRLLGWKPTERAAAMLSAGFMNCANYGLPVILLAFGQAGFDRAAIFVVLQSILVYSVAAYIAASGQRGLGEAARAVVRLPLLWSALVALAIRLLGIPLPEFVLKPIGLLANGAVVTVVLLLGMQVASIKLKGARVKIGVATLLRLVVSPVIGLGLVALFKPDPLTAKILVLESAMPVSVNASLLATEFGTEPDQVSGTVLVTTLLSLVSVSFWVWFLQR
ncbi:MAG TPA: AEC family transporter [Symbiobacteriaceae bacterium]|jgi:hypothetical protein